MTDDPDAGNDCWSYASATTLRGALQRGCGAAGAWVAAHRVDPELVLDCVRRDYRWDRQVDERAVYLARLVLDVELSIDPIVEQLWRTGLNRKYDGNRFGQTVDVLAVLGQAHVAVAVAALRRYVCEGERWVEVLQAVAETWPGEWWDDLAPVVAGRAADASPEEVFFGREPWSSWAGRDRRIDVLLERAQPSVSWRCPSLSYRDTPVAGLLGLLADPDAQPEVLSAVLHEFARHRGPEPRLLDVADQLAARPDARWIGLIHAFTKLGPQTVGHARRWARSPSHPLWWRAVVTLAEHGDAADVPALLAALDRLDGDKDDWCGYDDLARGFARLGVTDVAPRLRSLWRRSPHSFERAAYVEALLTLDPDATRQQLPDALADCEADVRLVAARHAPLTGEVRRRLGRLRDSPIENPDVREAAAHRLASG
ncbi:hypothetical protein AMES_1420 [Amycolatopsis mediterranei S699]|uniref:Uncharacterized protein n=2 Tax=Amycolatopsis mediterranei TaxID=33910 RepID=A0A0H3CY43_AMYMU|nr:hypothetical protein [Amycolatopsis mediterranei]ADJ43243.1 conserved hypothetical protein [Amycolatopsis mediterranei U32]AEK39941.1 hypothetical protein RAM_07245 [Amycolatopsis mediterranei S699]AFO74956.1 hypothetical protein AMES_1420 [Amycolatopsis mediterranei S699]AGT82085.1 hypothetical protein B737_1421 [Amycolatopsis mediterranei RB]KDO05155.1 hypothetical protein DV26_41145 [Amycolatopsis mediterranei]